MSVRAEEGKHPNEVELEEDANGIVVGKVDSRENKVGDNPWVCMDKGTEQTHTYPIPALFNPHGSIQVIDS
jgi:hypothetical protein